MVKRLLPVLMLLCAVAAGWPHAARADGGPITDPAIFADLREGQQVAVVRILDEKTASIDLFVSILDQGRESHQIAFFVPLGTDAKAFKVVEQDLAGFTNETHTRDLDLALSEEARTGPSFIQTLFGGSLLINGVWLTPLWLPLLLSGCQGAPEPLAVFTTESSTVSVFGLDQTTDIAALIAGAGLNPSVSETLSRLKGQQIAVISLRTQPTGNSAGSQSRSGQNREPGLHLSWTTALAKTESGSVYTYPLGTGTAWAHPIAMTRVYILAPAGLSLTATYPRLGRNLSGFEPVSSGPFPFQARYGSRIGRSGNNAAYAVDEASYFWQGPIKVWRAIYTNSNAAEDIVITVTQSAGAMAALAEDLRRQSPLLIGLTVAALYWVLAWGLLLPRVTRRRLSPRTRWGSPFLYLACNLLCLLPGAVPWAAFNAGNQTAGLVIAWLLFGTAGGVLFYARHRKTLGNTMGEAVRAFAIVVLAANAAYLVFALAYARLAAII